MFNDRYGLTFQFYISTITTANNEDSLVRYNKVSILY